MAEITLIIPHRKEGDWLPWTVENAKRVGFEKIIAIEDEPAIGLSFRRHQGIVEADTKYVAFADAHMDFSPDILGRTVDHLKENPKDVICVKCPGVKFRTKETVQVERYGASIYELFAGMPLYGAWYTTPQEEVGMVLGAYYAFRKDWYMENLGAIWKWHVGWGKSEQMISITNLLCGGRNYCLSDVWASHLFQKGRSDHFWIGLSKKRNAALIAYGMADKEGIDKIIWSMALTKNRPENYLRKHWDKVGAIDAVKDHMSKYAVQTWDDLRRKVFVPEHIQPPQYLKKG